jgi:hypothetical protein
MPTIRVDDVDVPAEERTFLSKLEALGPGYDFEIPLRAEWDPGAVERHRWYSSQKRE